MLVIKMRAYYSILIGYFSIWSLRFVSSSVFNSIHWNPVIVEQAVINYVETLAAQVSTHTESNEPLELSRNKVVTTDVCTFHNGMKGVLCKIISENEEYKLTFTVGINIRFTSLECAQKVFLLKYFNQNNLKMDYLPMFKCPFIEESIFMKNGPTYYVSKSHLPSSLLVFRQEDEFSPIRPHKFIESYNYDDLETTSDMFFWRESHRMIMMTDIDPTKNYYGLNWAKLLQYGGNMDWSLQNFQKFVKIRWPYTKFIQLYTVMNVCRLTTVQKIHVCKQLLIAGKMTNMYLDIHHYPETRCQKRTISLGEPIEPTAYMVSCPPVVSSVTDLVLGKRQPIFGKVFIPQQLFISTHLLENAIFSFKYLFGNVYPLNEVFYIDRKLLRRVKETEREMWNDNVTQFMSDVDPSNGDVGLRYNLALPVILDRHQIERKLVYFKSLFNIKLPYRKFGKTLRTMNICMLFSEQKLQLCKNFFEHQEFGYKVTGETADISMRCNRNFVSLHVLETMNRTAGNIGSLALVECTIRESKIYEKLYLSGSETEYSPFAYAQAKKYSEIYPIGQISNKHLFGG